MQNQDSNVQPTSESLPIGNANVGSSFSFAQLLETIHEKDHEAKYCVQYSDYEDNQWTIESLLLPHRIERIKDDNSIRKVFIKFSNGISLVVAPYSYNEIIGSVCHCKKCNCEIRNDVGDGICAECWSAN